MSPDAQGCYFEGCPSPPAFRVALNAGCVCYPEARRVVLCAQHWHGLEPLGDAAAIPVGLDGDVGFSTTDAA